jgi:membrane protease YdiL (CAAX protease family)
MGNNGVQKALDRPISVSGAIFWSLALITLELFCVDVTEAARGAPLFDVVSLSACRVLATSIVIFAVMRVHAREGSVRRAIGLAPIAPHHLALSAAAGFGLSPVLTALDDRILARFPYSESDVANIEKLVSSAPSVVLVVAMFVVIPIAHEVFFRGLLFGGLRAAGTTAETVLVTALLYTASSLDLRVAASTMLLGLALGWLRARSGSLFAPLAAVLALHVLDAITISRGSDPMGETPHPLKWVVFGSMLAVLSLAAMRLGRPSPTRV